MAGNASRALARFALIGLAFCALTLSAPHANARDGVGPVVVELFTSQACSACPPADRLLGELAQHDDIIALSLPVDYWDHLDWKDTLGRAEHSERQRNYARHLGLPNVYTPQIVVNGSKNVIGSRADKVKDAIRAARNDDARVPMTLKLEGKQFHVDIGAAPDGAPREAVILAVPLLSAREVAIQRGENRGKTITYHNVSRKLIPLGAWKGDATSLTLAHDAIMTGDADSCAVILQDARSGAILGAALLEDA
jgi:hypothetical protein